MSHKPATPQPLPVAPLKAPASPPRAPLSLHIDRLVLEGLPVSAAQRGALHDSLVAELETLFAAGTLSPELRDGAALHRLRLDDIRLQRGAAAEQIGVQIARVLHGGIGS